MRKKLLVLVLAIVIVASVVLTGCEMFTTNPKRDYKQVVATVKNQGMSADITKGELVEYFNQAGPMYIQYRGFTAEEALEECLKVLAKKEILLLEAKAYYAEQKGIAKNADIMEFLNWDEQKYVIDTTNKQFEDRWQELVDENIKDELANSGKDVEDEDEDEDILAARPSWPDPADEEKEFKKDPSISKDDIAKTFAADMKEKYDAGTLNKHERDAYKSLLKTLEDQYKDYNYFLASSAESRLLAKFQEEKHVSTISDKDLLEKYNYTVYTQTDSYLSDSAYKSAIEADSDNLIVYHNGRYVKVKSILIKFSEKQSSILSSLKSLFPDDNQAELLAAYRQALINGGNGKIGSTEVSLNNIFPYLDVKDMNLIVNVSNLEYKEDAVCEDKECVCPECNNNDKTGKCEIDRTQVYTQDDPEVAANPSLLGQYKPVKGCACVACSNNAYLYYNVNFRDVLAKLVDKLAEVETQAGADYDAKFGVPAANDEAAKAGRTMAIAEAKIAEFDRWIYAINDDEGMFGDKKYVETPNGMASSYVPEYTALVRALLEEGKIGNTQTTVDSYTVNNGTDKDGKEYAIYNDVDGISYIINDYGVHIVMVTDIPVDTTINDSSRYTVEKVTTDTTINGVTNTVVKEYYTLHLNAFISYDEDTGKALTVEDTLRKSMKDAADADLYSAYERDFFNKYGEDIFSKDNIKTHGFVYNSNVYNQVLNNVKKAVANS